MSPALWILRPSTASREISGAGTLAADVLDPSSDVQLNIGDQGAPVGGRPSGSVAGRQGIPRSAWKGNDALADASHGVFTIVNNEIDGLLTAGAEFPARVG